MVTTLLFQRNVDVCCCRDTDDYPWREGEQQIDKEDNDDASAAGDAHGPDSPAPVAQRTGGSSGGAARLRKTKSPKRARGGAQPKGKEPAVAAKTKVKSE